MYAATDVAELFITMCRHALNADHEEELLRQVSRLLLDHVGCDAVILRLLERYIQTRAVAGTDGTVILPADELRETWDHEDEKRWLSLKDGRFCPDVRTNPYIKPAFKEHALRLGLTSGFMVPIIRDGEIYGQLVFAWRSLRPLSDAQRRYLRKVTDHVGLALTAFQINRREELDPLTGLLNRAGLFRRWEVVSQAPQGALLFADIDHFKQVNDTRGHLEGDRFLQDVARLLRRECDSRAEIARWGGDEFVVLIPGTSPEEAQGLSQWLEMRIRSLASAHSLSGVGISIGTAHWSNEGSSLDSLLEQADRALYLQKRRSIRPEIRSIPLRRKAEG